MDKIDMIVRCLRSFLMMGFVVGCLGGLSSCSGPVDPEAVKKEVFAAEKAFEAMAAEKGIAEAFAWYAAEDAVILRGKDSLIAGKEGIRNYYERPLFSMATVNWTPGHIGVSADGSLAWTYGPFLWKMVREEGDTLVSRGVFHTVWKRQSDGRWKYVWD